MCARCARVWCGCHDEGARAGWRGWYGICCYSGAGCYTVWCRSLQRRYASCAKGGTPSARPPPRDAISSRPAPRDLDKGSTVSKHILVIDDREHLLTLLRMVLEDECYKVSVLKEGRGALDVVRDVAPDLIILDLM